MDLYESIGCPVEVDRLSPASTKPCMPHHCIGYMGMHESMHLAWISLCYPCSWTTNHNLGTRTGLRSFSEVYDCFTVATLFTLKHRQRFPSLDSKAVHK